MRYGGIKAVCLFVLAFTTVMLAYADEFTVDLESVVLEHFQGDTTHEWNDGRHPRSYEYSWTTSASKFASKSEDENGGETQFPIITYVETWPIALYGYNREGKDIKSLGIHGRFDRRGYNWIDLYPVSGDNNDPFEIPMPGRIRYMDLWLWGSNLDYYMEAYIRDHQGAVHIVPMGSMAHAGWKNMRGHIPRHVHQSKRVLPHHAQLKFVKFRIWTQPKERVDNFYIYIKQFKVLTDVFESIFDGDELSDPDNVPHLWANNSSN